MRDVVSSKARLWCNLENMFCVLMRPGCDMCISPRQLRRLGLLLLVLILLVLLLLLFYLYCMSSVNLEGHW